MIHLTSWCPRVENYPFADEHIDGLSLSQVGNCWTSLVAQWQRIPLPVQATRVHSLVQKDPPCRGAAKPVQYSY